MPEPYYWKEYGQIILPVPDRETVLAAIGDARLALVDGDEHVVVHHTRNNVRALMDLGHDYGGGLKAPIEIYYDWPRSVRIEKPFDAQVKAAGFLTMHDRCYNLSDLGTGKTLAGLWAFDYLRAIGVAKKLLVIAPKSTLTRAWADDAMFNLPHLKTAVLTGTVPRRKKLLDEYADVYIINHDGVKIKGILAELLKREDIDCVIVDELTMAGRQKKTDRWKAINEFINGDNKKPRFVRAWGLTGAPMPNGPLDIWAQVRLITPERISYSFTEFRQSIAEKDGLYKWVPKANATDMVAQIMQPAIRFRSDECVDLPPCMITRRRVELTEEQLKVYEKLRKTDVYETPKGTVVAHNAGVLVTKLLQVCCGTVKCEDGDDPLDLDFNARVSELCNVIDEAEGKVIVFVPYLATIERLGKELKRREYSHCEVSGKLGDSARDKIFAAFKTPDGPRVLVGQPDCMAHGLTLVAANVTVWFSATMNNDTFIQANGRTHRPGQTKNTFIILFEGSEIETRMYDVLENKTTLQDALLEEVKEIADMRGLTPEQLAKERKEREKLAKQMAEVLEKSRTPEQAELIKENWESD